MVLLVEYDTEQDNRLVTCQLSDNILTRYTIESGRYRKGYVRVNLGDEVSIGQTLNNPGSRRFIEGSEWPSDGKDPCDNNSTLNRGTLGIYSDADGSGPYARKITNFVTNERPAAYRAGTTSFFKNL